MTTAAKQKFPLGAAIAGALVLLFVVWLARLAIDVWTTPASVIPYTVAEAETAAKAAAAKAAPALPAEEPAARVSLVKPIFLRQGEPICASSAELQAMASGAPADCTVAPRTIPVYLMDGGEPFFQRLKVRFGSDAAWTDGWVYAPSLTNEAPPASAATP